jgi:hypothetical protein
MSTLTDISIIEAMTDLQLFGATLGPAPTWKTWQVALKAAHGIELNRDDARAFASIAGNRQPPLRRVRELWCVLGRRSGKSRIAALIACYLAVFVKYPKLAPGEVGHVLVLAASKSQAQAVFRYCEAFLTQSPILKTLVEEVLAEEIRLTNGLVISVHSVSHRTVRGRTICGVVMDEVAFWRDENSSQPDVEAYRALLPSLATTNGMIIGISSPYNKRGLLYQKHRDFFGVDDPDTLILAAGTSVFNPTIDQSIIDQAMREDPEAAAAEWQGTFRGDLSNYIDEAVLRENVDPGVRQRPFETSRRYIAFADSSSGARDSFCLALSYKDGERTTLALAREWKAPFDPVSVSEEVAAVLRSYRVTQLHGDAYASGFVQSTFKQLGIAYKTSELNRTEIYLTLLPMLMARNVVLLDLPRLSSQLVQLQRRTGRSGRDAVDHARGGADDLANACAGSIVLQQLRGGSREIRAACSMPMANLGYTICAPHAALAIELRLA